MDLDWERHDCYFFSLFWRAQGSLSSCMTQFQAFRVETHGLKSESQVLWFTELFKTDSIIASEKQAQTIIPPPPCFSVGLSCLCSPGVFS